MPQGKLVKNKAKKSAGSQRRKVVKAAKRSAKGWKTHAAKGRKAGSARQEAATTKAINAKNESMISGRAVAAGNTFFLSDIKKQGKEETEKNNKDRAKREAKGSNKLSNRLKDQLKKLGHDV